MKKKYGQNVSAIRSSIRGNGLKNQSLHMIKNQTMLVSNQSLTYEFIKANMPKKGKSDKG